MKKLRPFSKIFLLLCCCWANPRSVAQNLAMGQRLPASPPAANETKRDVSIIEALNELSEKYKVFFTYNTALLKPYRVGTDYRRANDVKGSLSIIFDQTEFRYKKRGKGNYVIVGKIMEGSEVPSSRLNTPEDPPINQTNVKVVIERTITGKVIDSATDNGLPGVNVLVEGTTIGTTTDVAGNYRLAVPDVASTLVFSYIGYERQQVSLGNQTVIDVSMVASLSELNEVVVVGFGTQSRKDLTGAISSANLELFKESPNINILQSL